MEILFSNKKSDSIKNKKVKIIATLGPASDSEDIISTLVESGVDVFRINLSHSDPDYVRGVVEKVRKVEKRSGRPIAIMGDLVGPKIRLGLVEQGSSLETGQRVYIRNKQIFGNSQEFSINFPQILKDLKKGAEIYLGDGEIKLQVTEINPYQGLTAKTIAGGALRDRMGFTAHGINLSFPLTQKDKADIELMKEVKVDALAVSFVQTAKDVESVINLLPEKNRPMVIAKIETIAAVKNAEKILEKADGIMVARGDLGFSVPLADLPHIQKDLITLCRTKGKPVITATQMLESMINNYFPTRAEVSDVANAILDGSDALMLSAETAIGKFPVQTVEMMSNIILHAENRPVNQGIPEDDSIADAVSTSTVKIADQIGARAIVVFSQSGRSAFLISRFRPSQTILAISPNQDTVKKMCFSRGVLPFQVPALTNFDDVLLQSKKLVQKNHTLELKKGDSFVISAGVPFGKSGTTNMVWVNKL